MSALSRKISSKARPSPSILACEGFQGSRPRFAIPAISLFAGVVLFSGSTARAANTEYDVTNTQTNLDSAGTYTTGGTAGTGVGGTTASAAPSVTSDVTFDSGVAYSPAAFTLATPITFGSLDDLSTTAITLSNTGGSAASTLTLGGSGDLGDSVPGSSSSDLLYVATGASLTLTGGSGNTALNLALGQSGNFDIAGTGTATISSIISARVSASPRPARARSSFSARIPTAAARPSMPAFCNTPILVLQAARTAVRSAWAGAPCRSIRRQTTSLIILRSRSRPLPR